VRFLSREKISTHAQACLDSFLMIEWLSAIHNRSGSNDTMNKQREETRIDKEPEEQDPYAELRRMNLSVSIGLLLKSIGSLEETIKEIRARIALAAKTPSSQTP
jgi:hypothetical protein